ncbi:MAG: helix-turn-helix domain-containing protein [Intrasporangiaceae bacterium]|nr:helix-turn-helix domain-containing protein [Intrasporangiaceae bacterium]
MSTRRQVVSEQDPVGETPSESTGVPSREASPATAPRTGSGHAAIDDLGAYIRDQRESARLSLRKLSKIAGVSNPYLSQIERGLRKPSAEILQAIAKALEISSETLYVKAGILEEREPGEDLESVVARDPHLSEAQRQALLEMYRSFKALSEFRRDGGGKRRGLFDVVRTGDVGDADIQAVGLDAEDEGDTV